MPRREDLEPWARDYADHQEEMGELNSSATLAEVVGGMLALAIRLGLFLGMCVVIYLIGRAIVGS